MLKGNTVSNIDSKCSQQQQQVHCVCLYRWRQLSRAAAETCRRCLQNPSFSITSSAPTCFEDAIFLQVVFLASFVREWQLASGAQREFLGVPPWQQNITEVRRRARFYGRGARGLLGHCSSRWGISCFRWLPSAFVPSGGSNSSEMF